MTWPTRATYQRMAIGFLPCNWGRTAKFLRGRENSSPKARMKSPVVRAFGEGLPCFRGRNFALRMGFRGNNQAVSRRREVFPRSHRFIAVLADFPRLISRLRAIKTLFTAQVGKQVGSIQRGRKSLPQEHVFKPLLADVPRSISPRTRVQSRLLRAFGEKICSFYMQPGKSDPCNWRRNSTLPNKRGKGVAKARDFFPDNPDDSSYRPGCLGRVLARYRAIGKTLGGIKTPKSLPRHTAFKAVLANFHAQFP